MGTQETRVLVIGRDEARQLRIQHALQEQSYSVVTANSADDAIPLIIETAPAAILVLWPDDSRQEGFVLCRQIRMWFRGPILVACRDTQSDAILDALDAGADDYLITPFRPAELLARIRISLRRFSNRSVPRGTVQLGQLQIDFARRRVARGSKEVRLTRIEFDILAYLAQHLNEVVTSEMILASVWGPLHMGHQQTLRVHIGHIRKKIEPNPSKPRYIITEPGVGYQLTSPKSLKAAKR